jgi:hypothetical protein
MKKTGITLMILGNLLHICSGMTLKFTKKTSENDDSELNTEVAREISCPNWLGIPFIVAGGILYLTGLRK